MKAFSNLILDLQLYKNENVQCELLVDYLNTASSADKILLIQIIVFKKIKGILTGKHLREWAFEKCSIPLWMLEDCKAVTGNYNDVYSMVISSGISKASISLPDCILQIENLRKLTDLEKKTSLFEMWNHFSTNELLVFNKFITGGLRLNIRRKIICKALAIHTGVGESLIANRLNGINDNETKSFEAIFLASNKYDHLASPYPFREICFANENMIPPGNIEDWYVEWKLTGIRAQIIVREEMLFIWNSEGELFTDLFPEFKTIQNAIQNGTVIDGEIVGYKDDLPVSLHELKKSLNSKRLNRKLITDISVRFIANDLLEYEGNDYRNFPLSKRREKLQLIIQPLLQSSLIKLSEIISIDLLEKLPELIKSSRNFFSTGIILKHKNAFYNSNGKNNDWLYFKAPSYTMNAVLIYFHMGNDRMTNRLSTLTFAVWDNDNLIPVVSINDGLTEEDFKYITDFAKENTIEKFGPVRNLRPELVFRISFEGIEKSTRHKSGVKVNNPKIMDRVVEMNTRDATTLDEIKFLLK